MSFKNKDFPTPMPPRRRMVYGSASPIFDVLMIPFLRHPTLLVNLVRTDAASCGGTILRSRSGFMEIRLPRVHF